jgi:hypothetical protein
VKISGVLWWPVCANERPARKFFLTIRLGLTILCLTNALLFAGGTLLGQSAIQINGMDVPAAADETADPSAPSIIFSNIGPPGNLYNTNSHDAIPVVGREVNQTPEEWIAIRFVPKVDVQATVLEAAVGRISGTRIIQLGIYSNNDTFGTPDTVLPGGQGSTTDIPDLGECCQLAKVTLPSPGVTLTAGTIYWLVASTDDVNGTSFNGGWQVSHLGDSSVLAPPSPWVFVPSQWPAARISGARLQTRGPISAEKKEKAGLATHTAAGRVKIFSNLNPLFPEPYLPGFGLLIVGDNVLFYVEQWRALPFTPRTNVEVKTVSAALSHTSGTNRINLGIYSDSDGLPGSPLSGGQGSLTDIPGSGDCCNFATLRLLGAGIALTGGVQYWLVASPDNVNAPDFMGLWQISTNNICAELFPGQSQLWTDFTGEWMAAEITGQSE